MGCGFAFFVTLVVIALMLVNSMVLDRVGEAIAQGVDSRIVDPVKFVTAVLMIFLEYRLYDAMTRKIRRGRTKQR